MQELRKPHIFSYRNCTDEKTSITSKRSEIMTDFVKKIRQLKSVDILFINQVKNLNAEWVITGIKMNIISLQNTEVNPVKHLLLAII